jgi:hypothetical protein
MPVTHERMTWAKNKPPATPIPVIRARDAAIRQLIGLNIFQQIVISDPPGKGQ